MTWRRITTLVSIYLTLCPYHPYSPPPATFLLNKYWQALRILKDSPKTLALIMLDMDISNVDVFEDWLKEEREYLQGLKMEPAAETLQMEYFQKVVNLYASK
jgi:hypothetical protein